MRVCDSNDRQQLSSEELDRLWNLPIAEIARAGVYPSVIIDSRNLSRLLAEAQRARIYRGWLDKIRRLSLNDDSEEPSELAKDITREVDLALDETEKMVAK